MTDPTEKFATPRIAAGDAFVDGDRVLLVRKTYGNRWDIPGGYVNRGESPANACRQELREEIGLERQPGRLLVLNWAPNEKEGDKILIVFDGGDLADYVIPRLVRRLTHAYEAKQHNVTLYLEIDSCGQASTKVESCHGSKRPRESRRRTCRGCRSFKGECVELAPETTRHHEREWL